MTDSYNLIVILRCLYHFYREQLTHATTVKLPTQLKCVHTLLCKKRKTTLCGWSI